MSTASRLRLPTFVYCLLLRILPYPHRRGHKKARWGAGRDMVVYCNRFIYGILLSFLIWKNLPAQSVKRAEKPPKPTRLVDAIKLIRPALVKILVQYPPDSLGNDRGVESGTGFFISSKGYIITNNHVIESLYKIKGTELAVLHPIPATRGAIRLMGSFNILRGKVVDRDLTNDLALIKLDRNPFDIKDFGTVRINGNVYGRPTIPPFSTRILEDGEQIAVSGFPLNSQVITTNVGYISSSELPGYDYVADLRMNPGNSGGPVYISQTGSVVGVAVAVELDDVNYYSTELRSFVRPDELTVRVRIKTPARTDSIIDYPADKIVAKYNAGLSRIISFSKVLALLKKNGVEPN